MAEVSFFVTYELYKSYDKNITGLAGGILFMDHTRQIAYTRSRPEGLDLV